MVTPGRAWILGRYDSGRGNMRDTAFRVTRRTGEEASTPAYQAATTVRNRQKASTATAMPRMVRAARKGCLRMLRQESLSMSCQLPVASFWFLGGTGFQPSPPVPLIFYKWWVVASLQFCQSYPQSAEAGGVAATGCAFPSPKLKGLGEGV